MTRMLMTSVLAAAIAAPAPLLAQAARVSVAADPMTGSRAERMRALADAGDHTAALAEGQAWAEAYPNEPIVRAAIYQTMAALATEAGDTAKAAQLTAMAESLDPSLARRVNAASPVTRGQQGQQRQRIDKGAIALSVAIATLTAISEARQQARAARNAPPPMMNDPYAYPQAPVGTGGYAPPPQYGAAPGYGPPPGAGGPPPQQPQYGPAVPQYPPQTPYMPPNNYRAPQVRGGAEAIRVVHDHSDAGDATYFGAHACGALLKVSGSALTFTPSGAEPPLVIPAAEIVDIAMNTSIGAEIGAFHVVTAKGLYLHLAPPSGGAAEGRRMVDSLNTQLRRQR